MIDQTEARRETKSNKGGEAEDTKQARLQRTTRAGRPAATDRKTGSAEGGDRRALLRPGLLPARCRELPQGSGAAGRPHLGTGDRIFTLAGAGRKTGIPNYLEADLPFPASRIC